MCVWSHAPVSLFQSPLFLHSPLCPVSLINGLSRRKNWRIIQRKKIVPFREPFEKQTAHEWSSLEGRTCSNPLQSLFNVIWQKTTISSWWLFKSNRLHEEVFFFLLVTEELTYCNWCCSVSRCLLWWKGWLWCTTAIHCIPVRFST